MQTRIRAGASGYKPAQLPALYARMLAEIHSAPGVTSVAMSTSGFASGTSRTCCIAVEGKDHSGEREIRTINVTPRYFDTLGLPLLLGRAFTEQDAGPDARFAIVNQAFARRYFNLESPVGKRFGWGDPPKVTYSTEIIGVVNDANVGDLREDSRPMLYYPALGGDSIYARTSGDVSAAIRAVRLKIQGIDPSLQNDARSITEIIDRSLVRERLMAVLSGFFGALAAVLAAVGLYGLTSYTVAKRTREIGIRMALGATRTGIIGMVWREVAFLVACGIACGIPLSIAAGRLISKLLFGIQPADPTVLASVLATLMAVASAAALLPGLRAASVDPMKAVRWE